MAKRFTDTEKWNDEWFQELSPVYKCLWVYICDQCDNAGVWKVNRSLAEFQIKAQIDWTEAFELFGDRCVCIKEDRVYITGFIKFQYGELSPTVNPHKNVLKLLASHGLLYNGEGYGKGSDTLTVGYAKGSDTLEDKDKDICFKDVLYRGDYKGGDLPLWKQNSEEGYQEYLKLAEAAFDQLYNDWDWIAQKKEFYPGVSIRRTLDKSWSEFWGTKAGWKNKRSKKTVEINWKSTVEKTFHLNRVFWGKNEPDTEREYLDRLRGLNA